MSAIELYSAPLCPYVHRTRLTLLEKGISFKLIEIDLQNRPANFKDISPYNKVPVLKHGDVRVWESAIINEYLEEIFPSPALLPEEPSQRAQARIWINFADTQLFDSTKRILHSFNSQQPVQNATMLSEHLQFIESEALNKLSLEGPYWFGKQVSLVDLTFYPWFEQWCVLEYFLKLQLPTGLNRLRKWWEAMAERESVRSIAHSKEFYIEQYSRLIQAHKS